MAGVVKLVAALTLVLRSVMAQPDISGVTPNPGCGSPFIFTQEDYTLDYPSSVTRCSGKIQDRVGANLYDVCAVMTDIAAERACWDVGVNLDMTRNLRLSRCAKHQLVVANVLTEEYVNVELVANMPNLFASQDQYDCMTGGVAQCFDACYPDAFPSTAPGMITPGALDCERPVTPLANDERAFAAVVCFDRNECLEGLLYDCTGPFEEDCKLGKPCADHAECSNTPTESYTCTCETGYEAINPNDEYLHLGTGGNGCIDIDECATGTHTCGTDICQNLIGSFVCVCNSWKLFDHPGGADECLDVSCAALTVINSATVVGMDTQAKTATVTCNTGYRASNDPTSDEYTLICRDEQWCSCIQPYCEPKPCGDPGTDPFASHLPTLGLEDDDVIYTCQDGYSYGGLGTYTKTCTNGVWSLATAQCAPIDLCATDPCHADAECTNIPGSFICKCERGYTGDGITSCVDADLCMPSPCHANADCTDYGSWYTCQCQPGYTGDGFTCTSIECGAAPIVAESTSSRSGDIVTYTCNEGYAIDHAYYNYVYAGGATSPNLRRTFQIYCAWTGLWEPQPIPHCYPISCGDPGTVDNSIRSGSHFMYEDVVTYTCRSGYTSTAAGSPPSFTRTCQDNGVWTAPYTCNDINECSSGSPCGDPKHYCINNSGGYKCSCAPGYRVSATGRSCEAFPAPWGAFNWRDAPCDFYNTLQLCDKGTCRVDAAGNAKCECDSGYSGLFCNERSSWEVFDVIAVVGMALSVIAIICILILCMCVCVPPRGGPVPGGNPVANRIPTRFNRLPYKLGPFF